MEVILALLILLVELVHPLKVALAFDFEGLVVEDLMNFKVVFDVDQSVTLVV